MGALCRMISPQWILLDVQAEDKKDVIGQMIQGLKLCGEVTDPAQLCEDVMAREELAPTGIGSGCAVPHAHSTAIGGTWVAVARLASDIDFSSPDGEAVQLVFLMVGPPAHTGLHLKVLSKLARLLHSAEFRDSLLDAKNAEAFYQLICDQD